MLCVHMCILESRGRNSKTVIRTLSSESRESRDRKKFKNECETLLTCSLEGIPRKSGGTRIKGEGKKF